MEIKELIREKVFAEIVAERDGIILSQHQQLEGLQKEVEAMRGEIERLTKAPASGQGLVVGEKQG